MVKELRHILRDRQTLLILLLLPLAQVVLFGFALRTDVHDIRIAFVDPAPDYATAGAAQPVRRERTRSRSSERWRAPRTRWSRSFAAGRRTWRWSSRPGFAARLADGTPARLLLIADASDPNTGTHDAGVRAVRSIAGVPGRSWRRPAAECGSRPRRACASTLRWRA